MDPRRPFSRGDKLSIIKTVRLTEEQNTLLQDLSKWHGKSESDFLRDALNDALMRIDATRKENNPVA